MSTHESITIGIVAAMLIAAMALYGYESHICKIEAIKAGLKGEEVTTACR